MTSRSDSNLSNQFSKVKSIFKSNQEIIIHQELKFDENFYVEKYPDILKAGVDARKHYIEHGIKEKRWPNPYFYPQYYAERYSAELNGVTDIFSYFLKTGLNRGHIPIPHFAPRWYLKQNEDVRRSGLNPYLHFVKYGDVEGRHPGPNFDWGSYIAGLKDSFIDHKGALRHWLIYNSIDIDYQKAIFKQLLADADMIDNSFYIKNYRDVFSFGGDPTEHFISHGARELRSPNPVTDMRLINLIVNPDAKFENKFMFYMENLYNYDLDHQQNNYHLWRNIFIPTISMESPYIKSLQKSSALPKVVVLYKINGTNLTNFERIIVELNKSVGCSLEIYAIPCIDLSSEMKNQLRYLTKRTSETHYIEQEQDFKRAVINCDFILTITNDVIIDPLAIHVMIDEIKLRDATFIYSDHDHLIDGYLQYPDFKPSFSPSYLREYDYCGPVILAQRTNLSDEALSSIFSYLTNNELHNCKHFFLSENYKIGHAPFILYHALYRAGEYPISAVNIGHHTTENTVIENRSVSIIIPMRDKHELTKACIESILTYTSYPRNLVEIIVVDNDSIEPSSILFLDRLREASGIKVLNYKSNFNFAKINNFAAKHVRSSIIVFLNNDTSVIDGHWLSKLVRYASMTDVGAVGAKLVYEDDTIQHGGCVVGAAGGYVEHLLVGKNYRDVAATDKTREISVITGACIAIEAEKFEKIGGFQSVLKVAWNDVFLCLSCLDHGYRNIYVSDALLYHYESKSRGFDNTSEQKNVFAREASFTRMHFKKYFLDDPFYNSNLSLESAGKLALPPRNLKPWLRGLNRPKKVLMLSCVYNIGYGVPVVMERHSKKMIEQGWEVHVGGPLGANEIYFDGCIRAIFSSPMEAASYAYQHDIPVIVSHTPPFFRVTDYAGTHVAVICYDYGEPNPKLFDLSTMQYLEGVNRDKLLAFSLSTKVVAISQAVKGEGKFLDTTVVGLGNDHLAVWSESMVDTRDKLRKKFGWKNKNVILNVCRFPKTERYYKGLDKYIEVMNQFSFIFGFDTNDYVWVLAGAAGPEDVLEMKNSGLEVFSNLPNEDLADLYKAADVYMSFSKWEGYNLGIGQALAMGLPVVASDIEAHREFPIFTSNSALDVAVWLKQQSDQLNQVCSTRKATIFEWNESAEKFEKLMSNVFNDLVMNET